MPIKILSSSFSFAGILKDVSLFFCNAWIRLDKVSEDVWNITTHKGLERSVRVRKTGSKYCFEKMV